MDPESMTAMGILGQPCGQSFGQVTSRGSPAGLFPLRQASPAKR
jgi:hypothetical protein